MSKYNLIFAAMIVYFTCSSPSLLQAGWVEERWTDDRGRNHQGPVTPPMTSPSHRPSQNNNVPPQKNLPSRQSIQKKYDDAYSKGEGLFNARDYNGAANAWHKALTICKNNGLDGCVDLETRLNTAIMYGDIQRQEESKRKAASLEAEKRAIKMKRQKDRAKANIKSILEDAAVDFDGTGKGVDLAPMLKSPPAISTSRDAFKNNKGHMDSSIVDLQFMDADKLEAPDLLRKKKGIKDSPPQPEKFLPQSPKERFEIKESASFIMEAIDYSGGDLRKSVLRMENNVKTMGSDNQNALEAYNYLVGLYVSEIDSGGKTVQNFRATQSDSKALLKVVSYIAPDRNEPVMRDENLVKNTKLLHQALRDRNKWLKNTLTKHDGDLEKALKALNKNKESGARYAYRFLQGLVAYHDMENK